MILLILEIQFRIFLPSFSTIVAVVKELSVTKKKINNIHKIDNHFSSFGDSLTTSW